MPAPHPDPTGKHVTGRPARRGVLPAARLTRLGITQRTVPVIGQWWSMMDVDDRQTVVDAWGVLPDTTLARDLADIDGLFDATAAGVLAWCGETRVPYPKLLALTIEQRPDGPNRQTLIAKLNR